jgi:hypothetical protein
MPIIWCFAVIDIIYAAAFFRWHTLPPFHFFRLLPWFSTPRLIFAISFSISLAADTISHYFHILIIIDTRWFQFSSAAAICRQLPPLVSPFRFSRRLFRLLRHFDAIVSSILSSFDTPLRFSSFLRYITIFSSSFISIFHIFFSFEIISAVFIFRYFIIFIFFADAAFQITDTFRYERFASSRQRDIFFFAIFHYD